MASPLSQIGQYGAVGAIAVLFALTIVFLWRDQTQERALLLAKLEAANAARISDAQAYQDQLLAIVKGSVEALQQNTAVLREVKEGLVELNAQTREYGEDLRELRRGALTPGGQRRGV